MAAGCEGAGLAQPTASRSTTVASASPSPTPTAIVPATVRLRATVTRVVDGDTIHVLIAGRDQTVRYIGIDTPETVDPRRSVQCFGKEASAFNATLVSGKEVELEKDVSETDQFGRLLRYVYVDGVMVNEELVRRGYAHASSYPPDVRYQDRFRSLEAEARAAGIGLWAAGACATPSPAVTPPPTSSPALAPTSPSGCSAAYPTVCIPPPPPDLDCGEITYRRFQVLPPDPHGFDGDHDGIGCET